MERSEIQYDTNLPGYDALTTVERTAIQHEAIEPYLKPKAYKLYLLNETYDKYLHIHKVLVGSKGAEQLIDIGDTLSHETMPRFLDAAAWAYAEAALVIEGSTVDAVNLVSRAEDLWVQSLSTHKDIESGEYADVYEYEYIDTYRTALNLAYAPVLKSMLVGNVTRSVRERVFADTLAIAQLAGIHLELAVKEDNYSAVSEYSGFIHECNALLALLYLDDPRYIPIPSSARADTGYYHPDQTHDITVINQHYGQIKKIIPIEVKAAASLQHKNRYKALIIRGKMHLGVNTGHDPREMLDAFAQVFDHTTDRVMQQNVDNAAVTVRELLRLYQQGISPESIAVNSLTQFHDTAHVEQRYPELSRSSQAKKKAA